ncbi:MAG: SGNH/GDSL hydrolase family protein [Spirochaetia bacterium]
MSEKTILCYGDSNTWGWDPASMSRLGPQERWTGVLQEGLGTGYRVIEEGMNARTTVWDDPLEPHRNGKTYLPPCLLSHMPLDLVLILLGTNDLKTRFGASSYEIADAAGKLVQLVQESAAGPNGGAPEVLLCAPPPIGDVSNFGGNDPAYAGVELSFAGGVEKSKQFAEHYRRVAEAYACGFFDVGTVIRTSELDGIHWEAESHRALGEALAAVIR